MNLKEQLHLFFSQPAFLACLFSWLSAQLVKTLIKLFSGKVHSLKELFELLLWRTGSTQNLKPEQVMETLYKFMDRSFDPFALCIHRCETYGANFTPLEKYGDVMM